MTRELFILITLFITVGAVLAWIVLGLADFRWELRRLNMEIARTSGDEQKMWRALRRRLWLSLLPFIKY